MSNLIHIKKPQDDDNWRINVGGLAREFEEQDGMTVNYLLSTSDNYQQLLELLAEGDYETLKLVGYDDIKRFIAQDTHQAIFDIVCKKHGYVTATATWQMKWWDEKVYAAIDNILEKIPLNA